MPVVVTVEVRVLVCEAVFEFVAPFEIVDVGDAATLAVRLGVGKNNTGAMVCTIAPVNVVVLMTTPFQLSNWSTAPFSRAPNGPPTVVAPDTNG